MAILRSSHKVGNTKPQARPFGALLSRISQRSELAAPRYEDSTKLGIAQVWGRWTVYVSPNPRCPRLSSWAEANKTLPGSVRKSTTSPTISVVPIPSKYKYWHNPISIYGELTSLPFQCFGLITICQAWTIDRLTLPPIPRSDLSVDNDRCRSDA